MKLHQKPLSLGLGVIAAHSAAAAPFSDDFSADTSADYIGTVTYGAAGGGFDISGGTLNVDSSGGRTFDVFHTTASLEPGEQVSVDVVAGFPNNFYLTVSTTTRGPNTGTEDGIRFAFNTSNQLMSRVYGDGTEIERFTYDTIDPPAEGIGITMYILRNTETNFSVGYDYGEGMMIADTYDILEVGSQSLFIGVEDFSSVMSFDNLKITAIGDAGLVGDTDGDGDVDDFDLINAITNYTGSLDAGVGGKGVPEGDTDGDQDVDDFDLIEMITGYTGSLSAPAVPEPGSLALLALSGMGMLHRRRA